MLLKAEINGRRGLSEHPAIPISPEQQAKQAAMAVAAGAGAIHVHPRNSAGQESLAPQDIADALNAIRAACPTTPIGVSAGGWIVPEIDRRLTLIGGWEVLPDFADVNFHEPGAVQTCRLFLEKGVGVEAGIWNAEAAHRFRRSGCQSVVCASSLSQDKNRETPRVVWTRLRQPCKTLRGDASYTASKHRRGNSSLWHLVAAMMPV
jgi:uncharacterized protein (DUF849 family)